MSQSLAPQNMYKDEHIRVPRYRYARIPLNNLPSGIVSIQPTSTTLLEWKLSANTVFNLSRSHIGYQYQIPASSGNYCCTFEDGHDFRYAYFGNGSGLGIVDLQFSDCLVNSVRPIATSQDNYLTHDPLTQFYKSNQLAATNILPFSRDGLLAGIDNGSTTNYLESQHLAICTTPNTAVNVSRYIPLSNYKDTAFEMDKDLVFGSDMYLRFNTQYLQRMAFYTTTPNNPNVAGNFTAITAAANAVNMYLYLAIEENIDIRNSLLSHLASGAMRMTIPYTYMYRFASSGNTSSANISLTLTKNYGRAVKKITVLPYNAQEYTQYAFDHSNVNGTKLASIQSTMDGRPNTDYVLNCYNPNSSIIPTGVTLGQASFADDYRESLKFTKGSCLFCYADYQTQWFYADAWGVPNNGTQEYKQPQENVCDGFDLLHSGDHVYAIQATTPALQTSTNNCYTNGLVMYVAVKFIRTLEIKSDGILLSP